MDKQIIISLIKQRIIDEHRKHKSINWEEIAASKIYSLLFETNALEKRKEREENLKIN